MDRKQVLELALQALQRQKEEIAVEIAAIQDQLSAAGSSIRQTRSLPSAGTRRRRTLAERKAQSLRMKRYWAAKKRGQITKPATAVPKTPISKVRTKTDAEKRMLSLKMKAAWKRRRAAKKASKAAVKPSGAK